MKIQRAVLTALLLLTAPLLLPLGCNGGESTEEATEVCQRQQQAQANCIDDAAFAACVACREECGRECMQLESCPLQFTCP